MGLSGMKGFQEEKTILLPDEEHIETFESKKAWFTEAPSATMAKSNIPARSQRLGGENFQR